MHPFPPGPQSPYGPDLSAPGHRPATYGPPGRGLPPGMPPGSFGPPPGYSGPQPGYHGPPRLGPYGPPHAPPAPGAGTATVVLLCRIGAVLLVALGLSIPFDDTCGWVSYPAWSAFAILAAVTALLPQFGASFGWSSRAGWLVGAVATGALLGFWVLIALPGITSDAGFCLTVGTAAAAAACWFSPGRRW